MTNEIKEILYKLKNIHNFDYSETCDNENNIIEKEYDIYLSKKDTDLLLDYITNLQEENERLKEENKHIFANVNDDQLLRSNAINWAEAQDYKSRIEKAVEYINKYEYEKYCPGPYEKDKYIMREEKEGQDLLNILRGDE